SNGNGAFIFVNNFQRGLAMPEKRDVQFEIKLAGGSVRVPDRPITIPADSSFFWPVNLDIAGAKLIYATAQPICSIDAGDLIHVSFLRTRGVPTEFVFDETTVQGPSRFNDSGFPNGPMVKVQSESGRKIHITVADEPNLWKAT